MKRTKSLQYHQSLQFAVVACLPVLVVVTLVGLFLLPAMQSDTAIRHQSIARSIAGQISSHVLGGQRQLSALADFLKTREGLSNRQVTALLDSQCGEGEFFETIYISAPRQQVVIAVGLARPQHSLRRDLLGLDLSGRTFIKEAGNPEKPVWSATFTSTISRRMAVALTIPLAGNLITGEITLDNLSSVISQLPMENGFLIYVIDPNGRIVADSQQVRRGQRMEDSIFSFAGPGHGGGVTSGSFELDGTSYLGTVVVIEDLGWKVLVAQPISKAYKSLRSTLITFVLGLTMTLILALFLSCNRARRLSRLFHAYAEKAGAIAGGSYDKIWPASDITELDQMGESLRHMAGTIAQREKELLNLIQQLKESEERFKALHNASFGGISIHDRGLILECNQGLSEMTGYSVDELTGMDGLLLIAKKSRKMVMDKMGSGYEKPYEAYGLRKNGEEFPVRLEARNIPYKGKQVSTLELRDITEQKKMEEIIIQNEKMLSVGGLAAGMAHEINNPLAGMIQTANVMKSRLEDLEMQANLKAAQDAGVSVDQIRTFMEKRNILRMLEAINESGQRIAEIVDNMLSFARQSNSAFSLHHPAQLMDKSLELAATDYDLKKHYDFKAIKIIKEYEENLPMISCEGTKIQQVLLNILGNGAQAMQSQDTDSNYIPCFTLRLAKEENMLRMEIQDNGPGMDETIQSKIFEPFFTTKPVGVGTGLGLSVSYFIITQNHHGTLNVVSSLKKGATFIIRLPLEYKQNQVLGL